MEYVHGGDIYTYKGMLDFSVNINPFGPSEEVVKAVRESAKQIGVYPDSLCRELKRTLAKQQGIREEMLVFGNGAAELIFSLVMAMKPKKALLTAPCFQEYAKALKAIGCQITYHYLNEEEEFRLTKEYLHKLTKDVDMVFLCAPDNPSGQMIDKNLLMEVMKKCEEQKIRLVLDQCFCEFVNCKEDVLSGQEVTDTPFVFLLRAFTKMHAMPGIRLGYGICSDKELMERLSECRQPWSVSVAAQAAGLAACAQEERVEKTRQYVAAERRWMEEELDRIGIWHFSSKANYILLKSGKDLCGLLKEKKILIRDCSNYEGLTKGFFRAAVKCREENKKLMQALEEIYKDEKSIGKGER